MNRVLLVEAHGCFVVKVSDYFSTVQGETAYFYAVVNAVRVVQCFQKVGHEDFFVFVKNKHTLPGSLILCKAAGQTGRQHRECQSKVGQMVPFSGFRPRPAPVPPPYKKAAKKRPKPKLMPLHGARYNVSANL